ncbi:MAG: zinc ABC transporter substrate-binding protein [Desulfomicrobiaceae bacterium]
MIWRYLTTLFVCLVPLSASAALSVVVPIAPLAEIVQAVGGSHVSVTVLVPPGASLHTYEPKPMQMAAVAQARLYCSVGDVFDTVWVPRFRSANPQITVLELWSGIERIPMPAHHDDHEGDHGHHAEAHPEGMPDPHIWLDPMLVARMSEKIRDALTALDPDHGAEFGANHKAYQERLTQLDASIRTLLAPIPEDRRAFLVFHPAWGYFARAYGLRQIPIEVHGKEPSPRQLAATVRMARATGAQVIFVQPQISSKAAQTVAREIGGSVATLDPLAPDLSANLERAAHAIAKALR